MLATLGVLISLCATTAAAAEPVLVISDARVREAPPGATVLAGYLQIENRGQAPVVIEGFTGTDFERIELHRTVVEQGVARMQAVERLEIRPGETFLLEPGGMHLMLFNPGRTLRQDDRTGFHAGLGNGDAIAFEAVVVRMSGKDDGRHEHHHHLHH